MPTKHLDLRVKQVIFPSEMMEAAGLPELKTMMFTLVLISFSCGPFARITEWHLFAAQ